MNAISLINCGLIEFPGIENSFRNSGNESNGRKEVEVNLVPVLEEGVN